MTNDLHTHLDETDEVHFLGLVASAGFTVPAAERAAGLVSDAAKRTILDLDTTSMADVRDRDFVIRVIVTQALRS